jgi:translation initiation factor 1 (eIF-1/SUI1)
MPTEIYKTKHVYSVDGIEIEIIPLKIKYLKELMETFSDVDKSVTQEDTVNIICDCVRIAMKQYMPNTYNTIEDIQENFDIATVYKTLEYSAGINISKDETQIVESAKEGKEAVSWDSLDLAKLETEVFLLGIWKNFDELERSICIEELMQILSITRELDYEEKRFMAALQGIDLDSKQDEERGQKEWDNLKARVASGGQATDSRDILALQGTAARQAGFGIGIGLGYEDLRDPKVLKKQ